MTPAFITSKWVAWTVSRGPARDHYYHFSKCQDQVRLEKAKTWDQSRTFWTKLSWDDHHTEPSEVERRAVFSTLIGRGKSMFCSHWSRWFIEPALLCHKEPAQGTKSPLLGAFLTFHWFFITKGWLPFHAWKGSIIGTHHLVLYGIRVLAEQFLESNIDIWWRILERRGKEMYAGLLGPEVS